MSQRPAISLITVCHNSAPTLPATLDSIAAQRDIEIEHVIVDGASSDGTLDLLERKSANRGSQITKWVSEPDDGMYHALNKGLALATRDVIGILHADDLLAHDCVLCRVAERFTEDAVVACYGDLTYVRRDDATQVVRYWRAGEFLPQRLQAGWMPPHPTLYIRRSWYLTNGGFDTRYKIAADYDLMLRLFKSPGGRVAYLPEVLVRMRLGGASNSSLRGLFRKSLEDYRALRNNKVGGVGALAWKNLSKLPQFFTRPKHHVDAGNAITD